MGRTATGEVPGHGSEVGTAFLQAEDRQLSDRERTVLLLAAEGLTDKEIARHLNLSRRTIGTYWERMRIKLGPYSRTQLVARFLRFEPEGDRANYQKLFATWEEGVWILDPDGTTLYANHRIAALFGFTPQQLSEADARTLFQAATSTTIDDVLAAALQDPHAIEFRLHRATGPAVWLRLRATTITDTRERISAIVLLLHDVTVEKRVTHTLESCETTLDFVARHSSDLIVRFDRDLVCVFVNPAFTEALQKSERDLIGRQLEELTDTFRPVERWMEFLRGALTTGKPRSLSEGLFLGHEDATAHALPEPSPDFLPATVLSISQRID